MVTDQKISLVSDSQFFKYLFLKLGETQESWCKSINSNILTDDKIRMVRHVNYECYESKIPLAVNDSSHILTLAKKKIECTVWILWKKIGGIFFCGPMKPWC